MSRSLKYQKLTDEEILELATTKLSDQDRYYLIQELEYRNLRDKVQDKKIEMMRKKKRPLTLGKFLFVILLFVFGVMKLSSRLFNF